MITAANLASVVVGATYVKESFDSDVIGFVFETCTFKGCKLSSQFKESNLFIDCQADKEVADTKLATNQAFVARLNRVMGQ